MNTKQVIVIRKDLKMRRGKQIAQGCHASLKAILDIGMIHDRDIQTHDPFVIPMDDVLEDWLAGIFTKICVGVNSEEELLSIYRQASGMYCSLIRDVGKTEFNGVPTYTAVAVGPALVEDVDKITGHLKLL